MRKSLCRCPVSVIIAGTVTPESHPDCLGTLNAIEGPKQVEAYISSVDTIKDLTEDPTTQVQEHLTTHSFPNNLEENRMMLTSRKDAESNVFVNPQGLSNQTATFRSGAVKRLKIEKAK